MLGYDINTVEFAVRDGIPYAIDYMNPAPDAERAGVGEENFQWIVETVATYAIEEALKGRAVPPEYRWSSFLNGPNPVEPAAADGSGNSKKGKKGSRSSRTKSSSKTNSVTAEDTTK
jgi:hypothetical protein